MRNRVVRLASKIHSPSSFLIFAVIFNNVLRIVSSVILTRVLGPQQLGLSAIIQSIFFTLALISDAGFQAFVVRHRDGENPHLLDVIWSLHVIRGSSLFALGVVIGIIFYFTGPTPLLGLLLACAALTFAIDGAASPAFFIAVRTGSVRLLSTIDVVILSVQIGTTIIAAFILRSAWAIVIGMVIGSTVRTTLSFLIFPNARRRFRFDSAIGSELWKFSRLIASSSFLTLILAQIDKLMLASFLSVVAFGVYSTASNLALAPQALAQNYANRVIFPHMARAWRSTPDRMKIEFYRGRGIVFYGFLFAAGGLIGSARTVVDVLFDDRFAQAGIYLGFLAVPTAMIMATRSQSECLVATGRPSIGLEMNIGRIVWLVAAGPIAFFYGGLLTFLAVLASIELPAYLWGAYCMRRRHFLSVRFELLAWAIALAGVAAGVAANAVYFSRGKALLAAGAQMVYRQFQ